MAFIDFTSAIGGAATLNAERHLTLPAAEPEVQNERASLSALEWLVVSLARRDRISSLREPGRVSVAMGVLFGKRPNPRLADPKLEALRRLAVHAWHQGFAVPVSAVKNFLAAGYTNDHYELLLASISSARLRRPDRR
ncbi:hypothetical protein [Sphingomonas sp. BK235]|jgi:hypothetical protein|uniref:hypothetical protein n=1 Tax=Sphingomonas sp. BK235 TaxID=2512131 RepID=UPI001043B073|nr:hypothetical protein [Sphingomonas sp. BK235]TCP37160.1 hypothetical protein EV292_101668 [Sphingomonas sp. BK235]